MPIIQLMINPKYRWLFILLGLLCVAWPLYDAYTDFIDFKVIEPFEYSVLATVFIALAYKTYPRQTEN